jgi:isopenicillin-N N-acyltransferase like protein
MPGMKPPFLRPLILLTCGILSIPSLATPAADRSASQEKETSLRKKILGTASASSPNRTEPGEGPGGAGYRFAISKDGVQIPVVVVGGTPYQMGWQLGRLLQSEMHQFIPAALKGFQTQLNLTDEALDQAWATTAAYTDDRFEQELAGLAVGSGLPIRSLQHVHCLPLLLPYSCSSIAAWGSATEDGHLYQTRNLDWSLEAGAHEFPVLAVYLPRDGHPHVLPTFAGIIGANCGLNAAGVALSEMGDASKKDQPYNLRAPHFTTWFRRVLYDADSLTEALQILRDQPSTKKYHFVFGDGRVEKRAVKIRARSGEKPPGDLVVWRDNDAQDELAPNILPNVVYQDEGRGAFPGIKEAYGHLNAEKMMALACQIPIKGGNVLDVVFDATALRLWVSYAGGQREAYQRPFVYLNLAELDGDADGRPDLEEGGQDKDGNGIPDFYDPIPPRQASAGGK